jgi:hypothetical protein
MHTTRTDSIDLAPFGGDARELERVRVSPEPAYHPIDAEQI